MPYSHDTFGHIIDGNRVFANWVCVPMRGKAAHIRREHVG